MIIPINAVAQNPNDSLYNQQQELGLINIDYTWNQTSGNSNQIISIIGIGKSKAHEDLAGRFTNFSANQHLYYSNSSGLVGTMAANTNNSIGIAGINWHANVNVYDVADIKYKTVNNSPAQQVGISKGIIDSFVNQASENSEIIFIPLNLTSPNSPTPFENLEKSKFQVYPSFNPQIEENLYTVVDGFLAYLVNGSTGSTTTPYYDYVRAIKNAHLDGDIIITNSPPYRNESQNIFVAPAKLNSNKHVINVGGYNNLMGAMNPYQIINPNNSEGFPFFEIVAPASVVSTHVGNSYGRTLDNTNAGAIATGVVSLLKDKYPNLTMDDIRHVLSKSALKIDGPGFNNNVGYGMLNAGGAMKFLEDHTLGEFVITPQNSIITQIESDVTMYLLEDYRQLPSLSAGLYNVNVYRINAFIPVTYGVDYDFYINTLNTTTTHHYGDLIGENYNSSGMKVLQDLPYARVKAISNNMGEQYMSVVAYTYQITNRIDSWHTFNLWYPEYKTDYKIHVKYSHLKSTASAKPSAPTGLEITNINSTYANPILAWNSIPDGDLLEYQIYRKGLASNFTKLVGSTTNTTFTDEEFYINLDPQPFEYWVVAKDLEGLVSDKSNIVALSGQNMGNENPFEGEKLSDTGSIPEEFELKKPYPNPFNPTTNVSVSIPETSELRLQVYNLLGEKVYDIYSGQVQPGVNTYEINGSKLSSGVYLVKMTALGSTENYQSTQKITLIK